MLGFVGGTAVASQQHELIPLNVEAEKTKKDIGPQNRSKWLDNINCDELQVRFRKQSVVTAVRVQHWNGLVSW